MAVVLALLVFVPDVALAGSWASPAAGMHADTSAESVAGAPAQLVAPAGQEPLATAQVVLAIVVALFCSALQSSGAAVPLSSPREPLHPPGRRSRAFLHAYLN